MFVFVFGPLPGPRALDPAVINVCEHVCVRVRMVFVNTVCEHLVHEHCSSKP